MSIYQNPLIFDILGQMSRILPYSKNFLFLFGLCLLIYIADTLNLLKLPKIALSALTNPITFGLYQTGQNFGRQFYFLVGSRYAVKQSKALKEQIASLLSENANLRTKLAETEALVDQSQHLDPRTYNLSPARPIGLDRYLRIDKGVSDGIKNGQTVVFKDNYLGQIVSTSEKNASVRLPMDPDSKVSVFSINKEGKSKGIIVGQFGSEMLMDKILHEEKIAEGDLVYTEGIETSVPRGLIVGKVGEVMARENQIFKQAKIKPVFDIRDLELVFVIQD